MQSAVSFDYFYGGESEQFSYYRIPRLLVTGAQFKFLSTDAKLLYGLMLDRMGLSLKNQWYDAVGRVFIYYPLEEIMEALNCGHNKAVRLLAELDKSSGIGLIERVKQGQGKPAIIYVKRFTSRKLPVICPADEFRLPETGSPDFPKSEVKTSHNQKSRLPESGSADFPKQEAFIYIVRIRLIIVIFTHLSINQKNRLMRWIETGAEPWSKRISGISHSPSRTVLKWTSWWS